MTMLDRMRRHKGWLKWSLALVVLTFVVFYIPDFLTTSTGAAPSEVLAEVEGEPITVGTFTRRYNAQVNAYRNAYGGQINDQLIKQLGIDRQILSQLVDEEAMVAESRKQGITVSDVEIRERILALPGFQENGKFVGEQRYRQILQFQNPPMTTAEFEKQPAPRAADRKAAQRADRLDVGERRRSRRRIPQAQRKGQARRRAGDRRGVQEPGHRQRRRARRGLRQVEGDAIASARSARSSTRCSNVDQVRQTITVPDAEIEAFYKTEPLAVPDARAGARQPHPVQARRQGRERRPGQGRRSAEAWPRRPAPTSRRSPRSTRKTTRTTRTAATSITSAAAAWSPEFEQAAFAHEERRDQRPPVKTAFGFHIIKMVDNKPEQTRPLAEVRTEIEDQLKWQKAQAEAEKHGQGARGDA